jgi:hypothetical protein
MAALLNALEAAASGHSSSGFASESEQRRAPADIGERNAIYSVPVTVI